MILFARHRMIAASLGSMLLMAADSVLSGTLTIDCSQGRVFIGYGVNDVETCLGRRDIEINGEKTKEAFTLTESGNRFIELRSDDHAEIRARMDCATTEGDTFEFEEDDVETVTVSVHTTSGCQQAAPDLAPALLPEWNEELGIIDASTETSTTITEAVAVVIEQENISEEITSTTSNRGLFDTCANPQFRKKEETFMGCAHRILFGKDES